MDTWGRQPMTKTAITLRATKLGQQANLLPPRALRRANIRTHISATNQILVSRPPSRPSPYGLSTPRLPTSLFKILAPPRASSLKPHCSLPVAHLTKCSLSTHPTLTNHSLTAQH